MAILPLALIIFGSKHCINKKTLVTFPEKVFSHLIEGYPEFMLSPLSKKTPALQTRRFIGVSNNSSLRA